jgi:hypothetical protein
MTKEPLAALLSLDFDYRFIGGGAFATTHRAVSASGYDLSCFIDMSDEILRAARRAWCRSDGRRDGGGLSAGSVR